MVSVIIPTYNRAAIINRSIASILHQTYQDFEIIVVDDGSTDETLKRIMELNDPRIRYFKCEKRRGANNARNIGIQNAGGEYIAFQDSDDIWRNTKLEKQMDMFRKEENLDIIYSRYELCSLNGKHILVPYKKFKEYELQDDIIYTLANSNVIGTPTMVVKKRCFTESGMFDPDLQRLQDWEINLRFIQKYKYGFVDEVLVDAYESKGSITSRNDIFLDSWIYILKKHQEFFETQGKLVQHLGSLIKIAVEENRLEELQKAFGTNLFIQSIYFNEREQAARQNIIRQNYSLVKEWILKEKESKLINSFFSRYQANSTALYGFGDIGKLLVSVLEKENVDKIRCIIDRNPDLDTSYKQIASEELKKEDLADVQIVIITAIAHEMQIREHLMRISNVPVISVREIIAETVGYQKNKEKN